MSETSKTAEIVKAAGAFAELFADGEIADEVGTKLTCTEVETLADCLRAFGYDQAAQTWIDCHAEGDDCGDQHCRCEECTSSDTDTQPEGESENVR